ncbi:hypothetical protein ACTU46_14875 [Corynebacterium sp. A21]
MSRVFTNMGTSITHDLHTYGEVLVTKRGNRYEITPLTTSRDT